MADEVIGIWNICTSRCYSNSDEFIRMLAWGPIPADIDEWNLVDIESDGCIT